MSTEVVRRNRHDLNILPSQDEHLSGDHKQPITQFSTFGDTSQLRRSSRQSKPPDQYGVWLNSVHQNGGRCSIPLTFHFGLELKYIHEF